MSYSLSAQLHSEESAIQMLMVLLAPRPKRFLTSARKRRMSSDVTDSMGVSAPRKWSRRSKVSS
jgi:hypothetical protein